MMRRAEMPFRNLSTSLIARALSVEDVIVIRHQHVGEDHDATGPSSFVQSSRNHRFDRVCLEDRQSIMGDRRQIVGWVVARYLEHRGWAAASRGIIFAIVRRSELLRK